MANNILVAAIQAAFRFIVNLVRWVIDGVLNFAREVVEWFKKFPLSSPKRCSFYNGCQQVQGNAQDRTAEENRSFRRCL